MLLFSLNVMKFVDQYIYNCQLYRKRLANSLRTTVYLSMINLTDIYQTNILCVCIE